MENTLEKIYRASLKLLTPLTTEEVYATIVSESVRLAGAKYGSLILHKDDELKRVFTTNPIAPQIKIRKAGFAYTVFSESRVLVVQREESGKVHPEIIRAGIKSSIFVPLSYKGKCIGVLTINFMEEKYFPNKELNVLKLFGSMASLAITKTELYNETKRALETRDLFISMAAHELRTPLTTISGYVQFLQNKLRGEESQVAKWVEELSWETCRLNVLFNELLEVKHIRSGQLQYIWKEYTLQEITKRAILDFQFNHPDRQLIVEDQLNNNKERIVADFDKLLQVVTNLLDNAAKFSPTETAIMMVIQAKASFITITVNDKGRGINKEDFPRIFEGFYKGANSHNEGMGLGLYLAKNIIEQHHGIISIHSKPLKGTTVEVKLPKIKI